MDKNLLEVSMMLGDAIKKLDNLSAYKPDPYAHLKEAQERGEVIQASDGAGGWFDLSEGFAVYTSIQRGEELPYPVSEYRIKPKEKKKLYLWAYKDKTTKSWKLTDRFIEQDYLWVDDFYRLDSTMIEVEDEPI